MGMRELLVWRAVGSHKHVIRLHEAFVEESVMHMVMEKAHCCLLSMLNKHKLTSEKTAASIFAQMLTGLAHCHAQNVIHRDIKPENFLLCLAANETWVLKIADFGFS